MVSTLDSSLECFLIQYIHEGQGRENKACCCYSVVVVVVKQVGGRKGREKE